MRTNFGSSFCNSCLISRQFGDNFLIVLPSLVWGKLSISKNTECKYQMSEIRKIQHIVKRGMWKMEKLTKLVTAVGLKPTISELFYEHSII